MIREAELRDASEMRLLLEELGYHVEDVPEMRSRLETVLELPDDRVLVLEDEDSVAGLIHFRTSRTLMSGPHVEIIGLVVTSGRRGRGYGKEMAAEAIRFAEAAGMPVRVRCNMKRTRTHEFYRKLGLTEKKTQKVFVSGS